MKNIFEQPTEGGYAYLNKANELRAEYNLEAKLDENLPIPENTISQMIKLIRKGFSELNNERGNPYENIMVELSGGVDSSVALVLACEAVGPEKTIVVHYKQHESELETESQDRKNTEYLIKTYNIPEKNIIRADITPVLKQYEKLLIDTTKGLSEGQQIPSCDAAVWVRTAYAHMIENNRNAMSIDSGCLTEDLYGAFTTGNHRGHFGLTEKLLKSEVRELAKQLGLPKQIWNRPKVSGEVGSTFKSTWGVDEKHLDVIAIGYLYAEEGSIESLTNYLSENLGHGKAIIKKIVNKIIEQPATRFNTGEPTLKLQSFYEDDLDKPLDLDHCPLSYRYDFQNSQEKWVRELEKTRKEATKRWYKWSE